MSTIIGIAKAIEETGARVADLQGRITADKASLLEARAVMEAEHVQVIDALNKRHEKLLAFIDGQIAAKDEAIEGEAVVAFRQAAE